MTVSTVPSPPPRAPVLSDMGVDPTRPLVLVDVDEVLGLFMQGFGRFLEGRGLEFRVDRFALFQNIYRPGEDQHLAVEEGKAHFDDFFDRNQHAPKGIFHSVSLNALQQCALNALFEP